MSPRAILRLLPHRLQLSRPYIHLLQAETHRRFTMSSTFFSNLEPELPTDGTDSTTPKKPLALPEVPHNDVTQLDMSSGATSVKLDHLGPMVVNVDGTLARISNWQQMTDGEKEATLRIVGKRNKQRLEALKAKGTETK